MVYSSLTSQTQIHEELWYSECSATTPPKENKLLLEGTKFQFLYLRAGDQSLIMNLLHYFLLRIDNHSLNTYWANIRSKNEM